MNAKFLAVILFISFYSCQEREPTDNTVAPVAKEDYFEPGKEYVHMIPDSLRTPEQQAIFEKLQKQLPRILAEHVVVEDSILVLNMNRNEFEKTGVPDQYYDLLLKDIQNINYFSVTGKFHDQSLAEIWDNGKRYKELLEEQSAAENN